MFNAIIYVDQMFEVKNSGVSCLALIFVQSNQKIKFQNTSNLFRSSSVTLAEMRLNRTLMEWSIPIQLISATLAEMRLKRKLMEKIN